MLSIFNGVSGASPLDPYISRVRLKPWWLTPNNEFRAPGGVAVQQRLAQQSKPSPPTPPSPGQQFNQQFTAPAWLPIDEQTFSGGTVDNNRFCWMPALKWMDISEYQAVNPPPASPPRHSDSLGLDDLWTFDLQNPGDPAFQATLLPGQVALARRATFLYVSHGYALGLTYEAEVTNVGVPGELSIDLTWLTGTL